MTVALAITVLVLAALVFVLLGAQVELFDQVKQLRRFLDLEDRVTILDLGPRQGLRPSAVGLPAGLDQVERGLVLLLSDKCAACQTLAATLRGGKIPPSTWVVVVPVIGDASHFLQAYELGGERVLVDLDQHVSEALGLDVTPSAVIVEHGRLSSAQTVPSVRHLRAVQPAVPAGH